jgi:hypothetical protein
MTEAEWLACAEPRRMLLFLLGDNYLRVQDVEAFPACKGSDRKLRLFACACYWSIRHLLPNPLAQEAVEMAERFADGLAAMNDLLVMEARLRGRLDVLEGPWRASRGTQRSGMQPTHDALALALQVVWQQAPKAAYYASSNAYLAFAAISRPGAALYDSGLGASRRAEEKRQTDMLRCIFGHLFRPVALAPAVLAWNDGTAGKVAQRIYEGRAHADLPILADALEEAGCDDEGILSHLRGPGPHVRGCWAVDLLLAKE